MSPSERRQEIMDVLCRRRHDTYDNLAREFGVSKRTIRYDIEMLTISYPIETVCGRYGGGVKVSDWYTPSRKTLNAEQADLLKRMASTLQGHDLAVLSSILTQFAP